MKGYEGCIGQRVIIIKNGLSIADSKYIGQKGKIIDYDDNTFRIFLDNYPSTYWFLDVSVELSPEYNIEEIIENLNKLENKYGN